MLDTLVFFGLAPKYVAVCVCAGKKADFGSRSRSPVYTPENYDVQINGIFIWPSMLHLIPSSFLLSFSLRTT